MNGIYVVKSPIAFDEEQCTAPFIVFNCNIYTALFKAKNGRLYIPCLSNRLASAVMRVPPCSRFIKATSIDFQAWFDHEISKVNAVGAAGAIRDPRQKMKAERGLQIFYRRPADYKVPGNVLVARAAEQKSDSELEEAPPEPSKGRRRARVSSSSESESDGGGGGGSSRGAGVRGGRSARGRGKVGGGRDRGGR